MYFNSLRNIVRGARQEFQDRQLRRVAIDAFLVSYPKSGRTWLRFALSHYFANVGQLGFVPDLRTTFHVLPNFDDDPHRGLPVFAAGGRSAIPLIAVSHRRHDAALFGGRSLVFLVRDPRDVMVSAYFHATRHKHRFDGPIAAFLDDRDQGIEALVSYLNGWVGGLEGEHALVLSYEAMSADPEQELARTVAFLGKPIDADAIAAAVAASRFDSMQKIERRDGIPGHRYDRDDEESLRMRKGKPGGYVEYLDAGEQAHIVARCRAELSAGALGLLERNGIAL